MTVTLIAPPQPTAASTPAEWQNWLTYQGQLLSQDNTAQIVASNAARTAAETALSEAMKAQTAAIAAPVSASPETMASETARTAAVQAIADALKAQPQPAPSITFQNVVDLLKVALGK
jgi:hypothetical protein